MQELHKITDKDSFDNYLDHKDDLEYKYSLILGTSNKKAIYYAVLDEMKEKNLINNSFYENERETILFLGNEDDIIDVMCFMVQVSILLCIIGLFIGFINIEYYNNKFTVNIDNL